jgi:hypothetical protein
VEESLVIPALMDHIGMQNGQKMVKEKLNI